MDPEEIDDLIERYALNRLNDEERSTFEAKLKVHPEWIEKLKYHQSLVAVYDPAKISFRRKIKEINKLIPVGHSVVKNRYFKNWSIAAGLLILLSISLFLLLDKPKLSTEKLYDAFMLAPASLSPELTPIRGQNAQPRLSIADSILREVDIKYMNGNINEAINMLLENTGKLNSTKSIFQLGLLELIQAHPEAAIKYFEQSGYNPDELTWYKALAYLKLNKPSECRVELNKISDQSRWLDKAVELNLKLK